MSAHKPPQGIYYNPDGTQWEPEFASQRPPFQPGNKLAAGGWADLKHGAYSLRRVEPIAREIVAELLAVPDLDYLKAGRFKGALWDFARAEARSRLVNEWAASMSVEEATAEPNGRIAPLELARQLIVRAAGLGDRLGLSPRSATEMASEIAQARESLRRTAEREQLQTNLLDAMRKQWYGDE